MTNNSTLQRDITIQGQKLETVDHFKYLGAIICDEGSRRELLSIASETMAALGHNNIPLCMWDLATHSRTTEENPIARV